MKKLFFCLPIMITLSAGNLSAQSSYKIATFSGSSFQWVVTSQDIQSVFEHYVVGTLDEPYGFDNVTIDDDYPTNVDSIAYLVIKANATQSDGKLTLGLRLTKATSQQIDGAVDFFVRDSLTCRSLEENDEVGWKCKSTTQNCGGCIKIKSGGHVVGCHCYANSSNYCEFETTGGGGSNWPAWLTALILGLMSLFF